MKTPEYRMGPGILEFQPQLFQIHPFLQKVFVFFLPQIYPLVKWELGGKEGEH